MFDLATYREIDGERGRFELEWFNWGTAAEQRELPLC